MAEAGLTTNEAEIRRQQYGYNEIKDRSKKWPEILWNQVYGDHWYPNSIPAMMWIAIIVCLAIEDWPDAGVVLFLHMFNSSLGFYETLKASDAVSALKSALAPICNCKRDGEWRRIPARELVPGDIVILKIGDVVPADGTLCEGGTCDLDQSGLTGESLPVKKVPGDTCYSGTIVKRGEQEMIVDATGEMTEMGKGVSLIQSVESKGQVEVIMNTITLFLLSFAVVMNVLLAIFSVVDDSVLHLCKDKPYNFQIEGCADDEINKILANFIVLMISAIPIATPVVVTATMAIGARRMATQDAIVTRLSAIEELAGMTVLCSDKTGTLTKNELTIDDPKLIDTTDADDMIFKAALAAKEVDPDAIDKCVREAVKNKSALSQYEELDFLPFDPVAKRTEATLKGPDGKVFRVTKGAPQVILNMAHNKEQIQDVVDQSVIDFADKGLRPVGVAVDPENDGKWIFLGLISLFDPPRDDTKEVIDAAQNFGASVKMITGDHLLIAKETCRRLGMGDAIMGVDSLEQPEERLLDLVENVDGFAEVFPENKFDIVALYQKRGHITGMTGDGVNDAPALRKANIGFAVEGATAAAQGAASVILLSPGLSPIITAITRSRKIFQRLQNYLIYRVFMSVFLLSFFFVAIVWVGLDFPTLLIVLMCLILDLATMSLAYDKVIPDPKPNTWNLGRIIYLATAMGIVATAGSLVFLALMRANFIGSGTWQRGIKTPCSFGYTYNDGKGCRLASTFQGLDAEYTFPLPYCVTAPGFRPGSNPTCQISKTSSGSLNIQSCQANVSAPGTLCYPTIITDADYNNAANVPWMSGDNDDQVPDNYNLHSTVWNAKRFPYSSAVENMALFLQLCLSCNGALFSARVNGWFFTRRPGRVLLAIMGSEAVVCTLVAYFMPQFQFWDPNIADKNYIRLTGLNWRYIVFIWVYTIIVFIFMELTKMAMLKGFEIADAKKIRHAAEVKRKEEIRRRMSVSRGAKSFTAKTGGARHSTSLAPTPLGRSASRKGTGKTSQDIEMPLLASDPY